MALPSPPPLSVRIACLCASTSVDPDTGSITVRDARSEFSPYPVGAAFGVDVTLTLVLDWNAAFTPGAVRLFVDSPDRTTIWTAVLFDLIKDVPPKPYVEKLTIPLPTIEAGWYVARICRGQEVCLTAIPFRLDRPDAPAGKTQLPPTDPQDGPPTEP